MSENKNVMTIPTEEYLDLISRALLLEELVKLGLEEWDHFQEAVDNLNKSISTCDDEMQGQI